jgi:hypothetical protein
LILGFAGFLAWSQFFSNQEKWIWLDNPQDGFQSASAKQLPILLVFWDRDCLGGSSSDRKTADSRRESDALDCPDPKENPILKNFILIRIQKDSNWFTEFTYDDRYIEALDQLPKFFLLNSDSEIRDTRDSFPDESTLTRWAKIR